LHAHVPGHLATNTEEEAKMKINMDAGDTTESWIFDSSVVNEAMEHAESEIDLADSEPWTLTDPD